MKGYKRRIRSVECICSRLFVFVIYSCCHLFLRSHTISTPKEREKSQSTGRNSSWYRHICLYLALCWFENEKKEGDCWYYIQLVYVVWAPFYETPLLWTTPQRTHKSAPNIDIEQNKNRLNWKWLWNYLTGIYNDDHVRLLARGMRSLYNFFIIIFMQLFRIRSFLLWCEICEKVKANFSNINRNKRLREQGIEKENSCWRWLYFLEEQMRKEVI